MLAPGALLTLEGCPLATTGISREEKRHLHHSERWGPPFLRNASRSLTSLGCNIWLISNPDAHANSEAPLRVQHLTILLAFLVCLCSGLCLLLQNCAPGFAGQHQVILQ